MMSFNLMISMLRKGQTGDEILQILDTLIEEESCTAQPTSEPIKF
jgi:hypothetical protein